MLRFPIGYDLAGNLVSDGANLFGYDSQNRLVSADMAAGSVSASYGYGPENRRYRKTVNGVVTSYAYDGGEAIAEYDGFGGSATLQRRYVYGPGVDEPVVKIEYNSGGTEVSRLFYHADHQGSVIALSTTSGALSEAFVYTAYGDTSDSLSGNPYRYTGRRLDEETGLYYYRARYYSPAIGRFLSADPLGYEDGMNLYAYVGNDPLNLTDPSGLIARQGLDVGAQALNVVNRCANECAVLGAITHIGRSLRNVAGQALSPLEPLLDPGVQMSVMSAGPPGAIAASGGRLAASLRAGIATASNVVRVGSLRVSSGFSATGTPVIVDPSAGIPATTIRTLQAEGMNIRTVQQIFGRSNVSDPTIRQFAQSIRGKVLTSDRARQLGEGFPDVGIGIRQGMRQPDTVRRVIEQGVQGGN